MLEELHEKYNIVHEEDDMITPETVTNLKQDYIIEEPTFHKIDNEQEKKASLVYNSQEVVEKSSGEIDKIDFRFSILPKEKSYSVKEEHHMEPINES